ncbi:membrane integrity-associated transporter subunit PqiA [Enterobacteriaceae bacterium LUAb1]
MCLSHRAEQWMLCPLCDLMIPLPELVSGSKASCPRCHTTLASCWYQPKIRISVYALAALFMLLLANLFPFVNMQIKGLSSEITLMQIPKMMVSDHYSSLAVLFLLFVQAVPACCMLMLLMLTNHIRLPLKLKCWLARLLFQLKSWGMAEIFLAGVLVSFVKLMAYGDVGTGSSFLPWCLFCIMQLKVFQYMDRRWLWQQIAPLPPLLTSPQAGLTGLQQDLRSCSGCTAILPAGQLHCPRCGGAEHSRRKHSLQWTMALLVTSVLLYIPANMLPIMETEALGSQTGSTIMAGVVLLWSTGSWPIALIIFIASIMVPSLKMLSIGWLCWCAKRAGQHANEKLHVIYELVEFVGRWSMIDVFVIAVLSALVRLGRLMSVYPATGALLFALVVILTMFSAMAFDPRLIWDRVSTIKNKEPAGGGQ